MDGIESARLRRRQKKGESPGKNLGFSNSVAFRGVIPYAQLRPLAFRETDGSSSPFRRAKQDERLTLGASELELTIVKTAASHQRTVGIPIMNGGIVCQSSHVSSIGKTHQS